MKKWISWCFIPFLLCFTLWGWAENVELVEKDVKKKIEEVLKAHACYKKLSPELIQRTLGNFIEELDPMKTYFLEGEVAEWLEPSSELLEEVFVGFKEGRFSCFYEIHSLFIDAVMRRRDLEGEIARLELPLGVTSEEFSEISYASSRDKLKERLLRIKALQSQTARKLGDTVYENFMQRLEKRRFSRESDLLGKKGKSDPVLVAILKAATSALDSHTNYFTPTEANQFLIQIQQRLFGIGAQLRDNLDGLLVMRVLDNSPASRSNQLKIHDKIIAVNQEPVLGLDIAEAVELIRGEKNTPVSLTVLREVEEGEKKRVEKLEIELIRDEIVLEESRFDTQVEPFGNGVIATVRLFSFYQDQESSSALDIRKALEKVQKQHKVKGVILDLRNNSGGLLSQAVAVSGLFINKGIVATVKNHEGKLRHLREFEGRPVWEGPLVVLVNVASASSSEVVAQSLQDYGRAIVVGDCNTFGKGSFQISTLDPIQNQKINPHGEYKVTQGKYYTVSGKSPQLIGVASDIIVPGILSTLEIGEKFAKFPLENDAIEPHFQDDLSDLPLFHRSQLGPMYKYNLQEKLFTYTPYLEKLKSNSQLRIAKNRNYQNFLKDIEKKSFDTDSVQLFSQSDLQFLEALNILKDLIFLMHVEKAS